MSSSLLTYLDILIGFTLVMLLASSLVTVLSQWVLNLSNYRATVLQKGLELLLSQSNDQLKPHVKEIVNTVLFHPLVAGQNWYGKAREGTVIQREELVRVLLELVTTKTTLGAPAIKALRNAFDLDETDADTPQAMLEAMQKRAVQLEAEFPSAAAHMLRTRAIVEHATGRFVTGVMSWFDETSDRMTQFFAQRARAITIVLSVVVGFTLPLDSLDLLRRLSMDEALRSRLVAAAQQIEQTQKTEQNKLERASDDDAVQRLRSDLEGLAIVPKGGVWTMVQREGWAKLEDALLGILLSICLMSLGAPFWFEAMKTRLKLRPTLAQTEEKALQERKDLLPSDSGNVGFARESEAGDLQASAIASRPGTEG